MWEHVVKHLDEVDYFKRATERCWPLRVVMCGGISCPTSLRLACELGSNIIRV